KPEGQGTGLGLSTCYGIIKQAGGWLVVHSELTKGSVFKIYLPRFEGEAPGVRIPPTHARAGGTETILVAEDDSQVRRLLVRSLSREGYRVIEASNGLEALTLVRQLATPIHLLVTDLMMPGIT